MQKVTLLLGMMLYVVTLATQAGAQIFHDELGCSAVFAADEKDKNKADEEEPEPDCE